MENDLILFMHAADDEHRLLLTMERITGIACDSQSFPNEAAPV